MKIHIGVICDYMHFLDLRRVLHAQDSNGRIEKGNTVLYHIKNIEACQGLELHDYWVLDPRDYYLEVIEYVKTRVRLSLPK